MSHDACSGLGPDLTLVLDVEQGVRAFPGWVFDAEKDEWTFEVDGFAPIIVRRDHARQWSVQPHPLLLLRPVRRPNALAAVGYVRDSLNTDELAVKVGDVAGA